MLIAGVVSLLASLKHFKARKILKYLYGGIIK